MPSETTTTGTTYVLMFHRRAISLLISWYLWIFTFYFSAMLASPGTAMSIYDALILFPVYQYYVRSPFLDFTVRLNGGKVPQEFYGSSFDSRVWLVLIPFLCDINSILFRDWPMRNPGYVVLPVLVSHSCHLTAFTQQVTHRLVVHSHILHKGDSCSFSIFALITFVILKAWSWAAVISPSASFFKFPLIIQSHDASFLISAVWCKIWPCNSLAFQSSCPFFIFISLKCLTVSPFSELGELSFLTALSNGSSLFWT